MPLDETTGEHNSGRWEAPPPLQCHACEPLVARKREWAESEFDVDDKVFHVRRRDDK